jgi:hypothetical protein
MSKDRRENLDGLFRFGIDACNKTILTLIQRAWETAMELY